MCGCKTSTKQLMYSKYKSRKIFPAGISSLFIALPIWSFLLLFFGGATYLTFSSIDHLWHLKIMGSILTSSIFFVFAASSIISQVGTYKRKRWALETSLVSIIGGAFWYGLIVLGYAYLTNGITTLFPLLELVLLIPAFGLYVLSTIEVRAYFRPSGNLTPN